MHVKTEIIHGLTHDLQWDSVGLAHSLAVDGPADVVSDLGPVHFLQDEALGRHDDTSGWVLVQNLSL